MRDVLKLDITIPKCDHLSIPFVYKVDGEKARFNENDKVFFSVKKNVAEEEYVLQKSLENGIWYDEEFENYVIDIEYEDTKDLNINDKFLYDLVVYYDGNKPVQKMVGNFTIGLKITMNEVV